MKIKLLLPCHHSFPLFYFPELESEGRHSEKEKSKNRVLLKLWIISSLISGGSSLRYTFEGRFEAASERKKS